MSVTKQLKKIKNTSSNLFKRYVCKYVLEHNEDEKEIKSFLANFTGCEGLPGMVYFHETHLLFDRYYEEIENIRVELIEDGIISIPKDDLKHYLFTVGFEYMLFNIISELNFD